MISYDSSDDRQMISKSETDYIKKEPMMKERDRYKPIHRPDYKNACFNCYKKLSRDCPIPKRVKFIHIARRKVTKRRTVL